MDHKILVFIFFLFSPLLSIQAQFQLPSSFQALLEDSHLGFFTPVEGQFKIKSVKSNGLFSSDLVLRKKKSSLEIRYHVIPFSNHPMDHQPHLRTFTTATHLAFNSDNSVIAVHDMETSLLNSFFQADWGGIVYFQPKVSFSSKRYCKMVTAFKEEKGMVYIFFLFDDPEDLPVEGSIGVQFKN